MTFPSSLKICTKTIALLTLSLVVSCYDEKEDLKSTIPGNLIYKNVGKQIPFETGMQWIEFYKDRNNQTGRLNFFKYSVSATQLGTLLQSVIGLTGVAFHYAIDDTGNIHIIIIPVDGSLSLWSSVPGRIFVDANTGAEINQGIAREWTQNYQNAYPGKLWFHFFGQNIFNEMVAIPYFSKLDIQPAMNDLDLSYQLLLIIWSSATPGGRATDEGTIVYDASNPCPPCSIE
jgi:hypothetical protein